MSGDEREDFDSSKEKSPAAAGGIGSWLRRSPAGGAKTPVKEVSDSGFGLPSMPNEVINKYKRGVEYRGKLIGSDTVPSAKGDSMCHTALAKLKAAIVIAKQHKPRLVVKITDRELRLLDQDTRTDLHIHKLYKISYIVSDPKDHRAFGYVYGEKEGPWTFYGIKTEGPAIAVIMAIKELFEALASKKNDDDDVKLPKKEDDEKKTEETKTEQKTDEKKPEPTTEKPATEPEKPAAPVAAPVVAAPAEKKRQSLEDMLLSIEDDSATTQQVTISLTPRSSTEVPLTNEVPSKPDSVQDMLNDLFSPMSLSPPQPNPFNQPMAVGFPPQPQPGFYPQAQYANAFGGAFPPAAFPPQQQPYYGQPMAPYSNVPGFGYGNAPVPPAATAVYGNVRFPPAPATQPFGGFSQPMQPAAVDNSLDGTASLTPQVAGNAPAPPVRQAPSRPAAQSTSGDSWSFVGTGLPPRGDPGLFSEFLPGELGGATVGADAANKPAPGSYVAMGDLANQSGTQ